MDPFVPEKIPVQIDAFRGSDELGKPPKDVPILHPYKDVKPSVIMQVTVASWFHLEFKTTSQTGEAVADRVGEFFCTPQEIDSFAVSPGVTLFSWGLLEPQPLFTPVRTNLFL